MRRAIIVVPGFERTVQGDARDRLAAAILSYTDGWQVLPVSQPERAGTGFVACSREDGSEIEIDLYEAYWGDLVPLREEESPWVRFRRASGLILYWMFGGGSLSMLLRGQLPARTVVALGIAGLLLLIWYLSLLLLLLAAIPDGTTGLPDAVQSQLDQLGWDGLTAASITFKSWSEQVRWVTGAVALIGAVGVMAPVERLARVSDFLMRYLRDDPVAEGRPGLQAMARHRVLAVLDEVSGKQGAERYDQIHVVGHSLGGAIAVDALAEYGTNSERITLFTWGSALGLLAQKEPRIEAEIAKFYTRPSRLVNWVDVVYRGDLMGSVVPVPRREPGQWDSKRFAPIFPPTVRPRRPRGLSIWDQVHLHLLYYRSEEAMLMLLEPVETLPARRDRPGGS